MDDACVIACDMQPAGVLGGKQSKGAHAVQQNCDSSEFGMMLLLP